jgi:hypothetical protein
MFIKVMLAHSCLCELKWLWLPGCFGSLAGLFTLFGGLRIRVIKILFGKLCLQTFFTHTPKIKNY